MRNDFWRSLEPFVKSNVAFAQRFKDLLKGKTKELLLVKENNEFDDKLTAGNDCTTENTRNVLHQRQLVKMIHLKLNPRQHS